jgi:hypothetical protein
MGNDAFSPSEETMAVKPKRRGFGLELKSFRGKDGTSYIVFRTASGSFHVFQEVEAEESARQCGGPAKGNTRKMWADLW